MLISYLKYCSGVSKSSTWVGKNLLWSQAVQNFDPDIGSEASQFLSVTGLQALQLVHGDSHSAQLLLSLMVGPQGLSSNL